MDYEKKYKEAVEKIRNLLDEGEKKGYTIVAYEKDFESIFPELKQSEDEKIRKSIIAILNNYVDNSNTFKPKMIAWLEKQETEPNWCHHKVDLSNCSEEYRKAYYDGWNNCNQQHAQLEAEQNPVVIIPKFHEGDVIKPKDGGHEPWKIIQVDISNKKYRFKDGYVIHFSQEDDYELVEQKLALSEEDENMRKELIGFIQAEIDLINNLVSGDYDDRDAEDIAHQKWCKKVLTWLKKQDKQPLVLYKIATILSQYEDKDGSPLEQIRAIMVDNCICAMIDGSLKESQKTK